MRPPTSLTLTNAHARMHAGIIESNGGKSAIDTARVRERPHKNQLVASACTRAYYASAPRVVAGFGAMWKWALGGAEVGDWYSPTCHTHSRSVCHVHTSTLSAELRVIFRRPSASAFSTIIKSRICVCGARAGEHVLNPLWPTINIRGTRARAGLRECGGIVSVTP